MKTILSLLLTLLLFCLVSISYASPYLICDPYPTTVVQPTYFELTIDGGAAIQSVPQTTADGKRLYYDLASVTTGSHNMTIKACNEWGCSSSVPFSLTKAVPVAPANIKLEK